jgi:hypothetical protein
MIDFVRLNAKLEDVEEYAEQFEWEPSFEQKTDKVTGYTNFSWKKENLKIKIFSARSLLTVEGSLPNFYKGYNHLNFRKSEIENSIDLISKYLRISPKELKLTTLEFGVNIITKKMPNYYFKSFICYRSNYFRYSNPKRRVKKGNGIQCDANDYTIKIYNKSWVAKEISKIATKVPPHVLRFELRYYSPKLKTLLNVSSLSDLKTEIAYKELFHEFFKVFNGIEKIKDYDFKLFTKEQLAYFCLSISENFRLYLSLLNARDPKLKLKEIRAKEDFFNNIESYVTASLWGEIGRKCTMKWKQLITS